MCPEFMYKVKATGLPAVPTACDNNQHLDGNLQFQTPLARYWGTELAGVGSSFLPRVIPWPYNMINLKISLLCRFVECQDLPAAALAGPGLRNLWACGLDAPQPRVRRVDSGTRLPGFESRVHCDLLALACSVWEKHTTQSQTLLLTPEFTVPPVVCCGLNACPLEFPRGEHHLPSHVFMTFTRGDLREVTEWTNVCRD